MSRDQIGMTSCNQTAYLVVGKLIGVCEENATFPHFLGAILYLARRFLIITASFCDG